MKNFKDNIMKDKFYIETYGCQMNRSDSEIVAAIMNKEGYVFTKDLYDANIILINTCSIRNKAEQTIRNRLKYYKSIKLKNSNLIICLLGCMSEHFKSKILEEESIIDVVVGPDSYRSLPDLIKVSRSDNRSVINVLLSKEETYAELKPIRFLSKKVTAFVSIIRGCNNMCTFCVVPFTRGRERSRDPFSILEECQQLYKDGYREITLLGQNVDSYLWYHNIEKYPNYMFKFSKLLELLANNIPSNMRIRFSTSNPHDMSIDVLNVISNYKNICNYIHLPVQSGSNSILKKMNRKYTREEYIKLINKIRLIIPNCGISHDIIVGFCDETEKDHKETLSLMEYVKYNFGYMFFYSERKGTMAYKKMKDNIPINIKKRRLKEIITLQREHSYYRMKENIGDIQEILIENISKKNINYLCGRNSQNCVVVFPKKNYKIGDFIKVKIKDCTSATLIGNPV